MKKGFTLIELMIVVAIIAIIAAIAIPSLLRARITTNEAAAVAACKAYAEAQEMYHRTNWDGDGILKYAMTINAPYGLYETSAGVGDVVLLDKTFATGEGAPGTATPKAGYVFSVLTAQGSGASGGTKTYLTTLAGVSKLTLGYALSVVPASYDSTGRDSFIINNAGTIYQKDKGAATVHETAFCPNTFNGWLPAQ